jgi:hypothetical protein
VIASAVAVALGAPIIDQLMGLAITLVILRVTAQSWATVRGHEHQHYRTSARPAAELAEPAALAQGAARRCVRAVRGSRWL